jgi:periplasmic divalent cation tolerance protein
MAPTPMIVYVTVGSTEEAHTIARDVVERKLAACANILPGMTSIYRWEGAIQEDNETVLILKSTADNIATLTEAIKETHTYDCPCIIALSIESGNTDFLNWIIQETV